MEMQLKKAMQNKPIDFSAVEFIKYQLNYAIHKKASDLHFEPYKEYFRVRARIDGLLQEISKCSIEVSDSIISRLKIMADLDISEKRFPQDGHFNYKLDSKINRDCRINCCPTQFGEKVVVRILSTEHELLQLDQLGLLPEQLTLLNDKIKKPQGLILVTGPTGSGKTITLYSIINVLNDLTRNISTIEDPIEIQLPGINQVNVNFKIQLDFSKVLRALLRQDPDIILIGEIRDRETATMAIQAAQTGHLVLASLHTNNALETFNRLNHLGIKNFNLMHSISLIIAQRLLRKLCRHCKIPHEHKEISKIFIASSCEKCFQGYLGREGVFELFSLTNDLKKMMMHNNDFISTNFFENYKSFFDLKTVAMMKCKNGLTSLEEISRVII